MKTIHALSRAVIIDQGNLLLCKTQEKPNPFYFLPGGHIEYGESAKQALLRELQEETGGQFTINRFLGCLEYHFVPTDDQKMCHRQEYNFIFEADSKNIKLDKQLPQLEGHIELVWMPVLKLHLIDLKPETLKNLVFEWFAWNSDHAFRSQMEAS